MKIKIVADDKIPFLKGSPLEHAADIRYIPGAATTREDVLDADALVTRTRTKCRADLLEGTRVKAIASATIGYDHIDTAYCESNSIAWRNAPGCNAKSVAQYVVSVILHYAVAHKISLRGRKIGIIGVGNVGRRVLDAVSALGLVPLLNDPPRAEKEGPEKFVGLDELLAESDIITMHVPLERAGAHPTFHLADADFFNKIKKRDVFFINASRGEAADTPAVIDAIGRGIVSGAAIDVWENEPHPSPELMSAADFVTPHIAGYSLDGKANGTSMSVNFISGFFGLDMPRGWFPEEVPAPPDPVIDMKNTAGMSLEEQLLFAASRSYDVLRDDAALRASPDAFESLRGNYPFRREFPAYTVVNAPSGCAGILAALGFRME